MDYSLMDCSIAIVFSAVVILMLLQVYKQYFRTNDVSKIDIMRTYTSHELRARYVKGVYYDPET